MRNSTPEFGDLETIPTDEGTKFLSQLMQPFKEALNITHKNNFTPPAGKR